LNFRLLNAILELEITKKWFFEVQITTNYIGIFTGNLILVIIWFCVKDGSGILVVKRRDAADSLTAPQLVELVIRPNNNLC